jgi:hypothetical protein
MSDRTTDESKQPDEPIEEVEVPALSALLKRSLKATEPDAPGAGADDVEKDRLLLASVQRKLRQRSKGKFYADGWSTSQSRVNYALVAGVMLVVIVAVYLALGPMGISSH